MSSIVAHETETADGTVARWRWPDKASSYRAGEPPGVDTIAPGSPGASIKILHVITKFVDGAGGNTFVSILGLDRARFEPWIAGAPGGPLWARAEAEGFSTVKLRHMRSPLSPVHDLLAVFELVRLIRSEHFTIVHTHSSKAGFVGRIAAWLCRVPIIVHTIHGFSWHDYMSARRRWSYVTLERLVRPVTDAFLAVAPQVAEEAVATGVASSERTFVVPSAIELDSIPSRPDPLLRGTLGIPPEVPIVGTVGRFDFQKAPLDFVRMAAIVGSARPGARFVMVGEGDLMDVSRAEAHRLDVDIIFTGYTPEAARIASVFDVYVVCSLYEGLGRALCEAMASGRPVVATAVNGVVDLIKSGETGLLAQPRDVEDVARNVIWLLDHPDEARKLGSAGADRVRALFRPSLMCSLIEYRYLELLDELAREKGLPAALATS